MPRRPDRGAVLLGVALVVGALTVVGALVFDRVALADRIYPGTRFLGQPVGGLTLPEARALVPRRAQPLLAQPVVLRAGDQTWTLPAGALGFELDLEATVQRLWGVGRDGLLPFQWRDRLLGVLGGVDRAPIFRLSQTQARSALERLARTFDQAPVEGEVTIQPDGRLSRRLPAAGRRLEIEASLARLAQPLPNLPSGPVDLVVQIVPPATDPAALARLTETLERRLARPLVVRAGDQTWTLTAGDLARLLTVDLTTGQVLVEEKALADWLAARAAAFDRPAVEARLVVGETVVLQPEQAGRQIDRPAALQALRSALRGEAGEIALPVQTLRPPVTAAMLQVAFDRAQRLVAGDLRLTYGDRSWTLPRAALLAALQITGSGPATQVGLRREALAERLAPIRQAVDQPARDARFRFQNGRVEVVAPEQEGRSVDVAATVEQIERALLAGRTEVPLVVRVTSPTFTAADRARIDIREPIMDAATSFAGSVPARAHNIRLAASRLDGVVVPPGGVFSFNTALGPTTLDAGYQIGWGITLANEEVRTVPSVAGGICQVATTLFHAVFWAGLEIVERYPHLYWIPRYGLPPRGLKGLDATVDEEYGLDFRFRNTTGHWLAIEARTEGTTLRFVLYGTRPDWEVQVEGPIITDVVPADPTVVEQPDPSRPVGERLQIEAAQDGFVSTIIRTVRRNGQVLSRTVIRSAYHPARNVVLVGTKPVTPTPTPAPRATPVPTPTPAARS